MNIGNSSRLGCIIFSFEVAADIYLPVGFDEPCILPHLAGEDKLADPFATEAAYSVCTRWMTADFRGGGRVAKALCHLAAL